MMAGIAIASGGLITLAFMASPDRGYFGILPGLLIVGFGMGATMTPATEAITATLPVDKQGVASALNDTSRELGGAVGVALLGSIVSSGYSDNIAGFASRLPAEISDLVAGDYYAALGVAQAVGDIDSQAAGQIAGAAQQAWIDGWVSSMWVGVALSAAAFIYLLVAGPRKTDSVDAAVDVADPQPVMADGRALAGASQAG